MALDAVAGWRERAQAPFVALAVAGPLLVFAPLLPGLAWALAPAADAATWHALLANREWPQALTATLVSTLASSIGALLIAALLAMQCYPLRAWQRLQVRLPLLLALPHAAFAVGVAFLLAPSGWIARLLAQLLAWTTPPEWPTVHDRYALTLAFALTIKEAGFLLWALAALLGESAVTRQMTVARSLGYSRAQSWRRILWPQLLPRLGWPLAAVLAYGLSAVDVALILGPSNPPTLAVLTWRWLTDPDPRLQAQGSAAAIALCLLLLALLAATRLTWRLWRQVGGLPDGRRQTPRAIGLDDRRGERSERGSWRQSTLFALLYLVVAALLVWSVAGAWFFPAPWPATISFSAWLHADYEPFITSLWLGAAACAAALPMTLLWLEWGPRRLELLLYLPLIVPALPLAVGQYAALLRLDLDAGTVGLVWSHLPWVLPYMVLTLVGPYRASDARLLTCARTLGHSRWRACLAVKWPLLTRPLLATVAVGFAVSIAQYLPTQFAGGGRYATLTTEAVAQSSGGRPQTLAVQALLQLVLPLLVFALAATLARRTARHRRGLR